MSIEYLIEFMVQITTLANVNKLGTIFPILNIRIGRLQYLKQFIISFKYRNISLILIE